MFWIILTVFMMSGVWCDVKNVDSLVVTIKQGPVRGYKSPDGDFYVFYGIPYATAPTGPEKFKAPLPPPQWTDTYEAIDKGVVCPQYNHMGFVFNHSKEAKEDCLIANIYVPQTGEKNLPVLVYVHGGANLIGYGEFMRSKQLAKMKRAIIVNFNYRLGAHGFLCLGTNDIPGNAGMKDQVALFRWVKENIASFGGNPNNITAAGYSAGAAAVDLLQLSKMANNLIHKIIPESGANIALFSIQSDPLETAKHYAERLNFNNVDDIYALEEFYKTASYDLLTSVNLMEELDGTPVFSPCIERDTGAERFLDDIPLNILKSGKYQKRPMLYGFAKMEGLLRSNMFDQWKNIMNTRFPDVLPANLRFESPQEKEKVAAKIKEFYFGKKPVDGDNIMGFIDYYTDILFTYPTLKSVKLQAAAGNDQIYLYEYAYVDEYSTPIPYLNSRGADHCAQTIAVNDGVNIFNSDETNIPDDFKNMKQTIRALWLNFVETGKPVPEGSSLPAWPPTGKFGSPYMVLDRVLELKETPMLEKRMLFWEEIYTKHYRFPVPPPEPQAKQENKETRADL